MKSNRVHIILFLMFVVCFCLIQWGCKTSPPVPKEMKTSVPQGNQSELISVNLGPQKKKSIISLALMGENCCGQFQPQDPDKIIFLSRQRLRHPHFQIYQYDLISLKEKRLSFHDGDDQGVALDPKNQHLVYASLTDSTKENPIFLSTILKKEIRTIPSLGFKPSWSNGDYELYLSENDGSQVERLTQNFGFDAEPRFTPEGSAIYYTSTFEGNSALMEMNIKTKKIRKIIGNNSNYGEVDIHPQGNKIVFVVYSKDLMESQIALTDSHGKNLQTLTTGPGLKLSPRWFPGGNKIVYSSNSNNGKNFDLYTIDLNPDLEKKSLPTRLSFLPGNSWLPQPSPDGSKVLLTNDSSGKLQLYLMPL
ncbi:MAG: hypothetical protein K1X29_02500 [Bdellovibrionales bacterium]|nr:hypothetical protein [Bdellovibrionales bacterium]